MSAYPIRFGLIVTGKGERESLHEPFNRALAPLANCVFEVIRKCEQLRPRQQPVRKLSITGTTAKVPTRDQEIGLTALGYMREDPECRYVLLIDDLERDDPIPVFKRYRDALDSVLARPGYSARASVHFLVHMIEAYFFAHADAVNAVAGCTIMTGDHPADVEALPHPKNQLRTLWSDYDEVEQAGSVLQRLDLAHVLSRPDQCRWLRSIIAWCMHRLSEREAFWLSLDPSAFRLDTGDKATLTYSQELPVV